MLKIYSEKCLSRFFNLKIAATAIFLFSITNGWSQTVLASWNFDAVVTTNTGTAPTVSTGSAEADAGLFKTGSFFTALHSNATTVWSNPAGNGSAKSVSSTKWGIGDYWQILLSTTDATNHANGISIKFDQTGSNTGPANFKVQYSTDGTLFTDFANYTIPNDGNATPAAIGWTAGSTVATTTFTFDLSSISALNSVASVYLRLVNTSNTSINAATVTTVGTDRIDNFIVSATSIILPISLISFNATKLGNSNLITWTADNAENFNYFELERKTDSSDFSTIAPIQLNQTNNYSFNDYQAAFSTNYYRLKMIDKDGSFSYSKTVAIINSRTCFVVSSVYPTITKSNVVVEGFSSTNVSFIVSVYNLSGQKLLEQSNTVNQSFQQNIDFSKLANGMYILKISNGDKQSTYKIIKE